MKMEKENLHISLISSTDKILPEDKFPEDNFLSYSALKGEKLFFQAAVNYSGDFVCNGKITLGIDPGIKYKTYEEKYVPVTLPSYKGKHDDWYVSNKPGLYPDLLSELNGTIRLIPDVIKVILVELDVDYNSLSGEHEIVFTLETENGEKVEKTFTLNVINVQKPKQNLLVTQWFHYDSLASYYGVEPLSEEHWKIIGKYLDNYAEYGGNMILTPIFTPPLDTEIGGERPTVQLIDIEKKDNSYIFSFDKLERFINLCQSKGITYFEIAHLFTQWGAEFTPKIVSTDGEKLAGWHVKADSEEYKALIIPMLTELKVFLKEKNMLERCYFHISDEPEDSNIENYTKAVNVVKDILADCNVMDALSETKFYESGLVRLPVAADNHVKAFIQKGISPLWTYYCCVQGKDYASNRFIAMPSERNRILASEIFKYKINGFLHWGYNFYYSSYSKYLINPYLVNDADAAFPAGDPFIVYPLAGGKVAPSLRQLVFKTMLEDLSAMEKLEEFMPHDKIINTIETELNEKISFTFKPKDEHFTLKVREIVNRLLMSFV